jgi:hypothetical protein
MSTGDWPAVPALAIDQNTAAASQAIAYVIHGMVRVAGSIAHRGRAVQTGVTPAACP